MHSQYKALRFLFIVNFKRIRVNCNKVFSFKPTITLMKTHYCYPTPFLETCLAFCFLLFYNVIAIQCLPPPLSSLTNQCNLFIHEEFTNVAICSTCCLLICHIYAPPNYIFTLGLVELHEVIPHYLWQVEQKYFGGAPW